MTYPSNPEIAQIIDLLFGADKDPSFIDGSVEVWEFLDEDADGWLSPSDFLKKASEAFGVLLSEEELKLTIPQLADYVRARRTRL